MCVTKSESCSPTELLAGGINSKPSEPVELGATSTRRRLKIWEIRGHIECSLVGTCLSDEDLRKILGRCRLKFPNDITSYDLHGYFTEQIKTDNTVSRAVQKLLDRRHGGIVRRVGKTKGADLKSLWDKEFAAGRIPGAYWAFQTHNHIPSELDYQIFGEVHMLSHLLGRTEHATAARASEFQARIADLEEKLSRTVQRHQEVLRIRDNEISTLKARLAKANSNEALTSSGTSTKLQSFRSSTKHERALSVARQRAHRAEARVVELEKMLHRQRKHNIKQSSTKPEEIITKNCPGALACRLSLAEDENLRILYIGGRTSAIDKLRNIAIAASAELFHHDGGQHQALSRISDLISQCHVVFCPINCVSHSASLHAKDLCHRCDKAFIPLRSAGGTTFARALQQIELKKR